MKQIIRSLQFTFLALVILSFTGCLKDDDILTDGVRTGGLVKVTANVPYKLGYTPTFNLPVTVPQGAAIKEVKIYKQFFHGDVASAEVLQGTLNIGGTNESEALSKNLSMTWADLIKDIVIPGYTLPTDELVSVIGDYWVFRFVSVMQSDDKEIINLATTKVAIANFFAGSYKSHRIYFHPAYGPYPNVDGAYKDETVDVDLIAVDPTTCKFFFGVWEDNYVFVHIDGSNNVTLTFDRTAFVGDPWNSAKVCSYDPATGVIQVYYHYFGSAGADPLNPTGRIFWQTFTPNN